MLNPSLNRNQLSIEFSKNKRIQIDNIFSEKYAEKIHHCLADQVPWQLVYKNGHNEDVERISHEELNQYTQEQTQQLSKQINQLAQSDFQFAYSRYAMLTAYNEQRDQHLYTKNVIEYIGSRHFLEFLKSITQDPRVGCIDAQATCYLPGHFLKKHDDAQDEQGIRLYAYVLNFSKNWQADWGGLLQFVDMQENVLQTFTPKYNSLCMFQVPQYHIVSLVSQFAQEKRLAITGWLTKAVG